MSNFPFILRNKWDFLCFMIYSNQDFNKAILYRLKQIVDKYPDARFGQILTNYVLEYEPRALDGTGLLTVKDPFYELSKDTLIRLVDKSIEFSMRKSTTNSTTIEKVLPPWELPKEEVSVPKVVDSKQFKTNKIMGLKATSVQPLIAEKNILCYKTLKYDEVRNTFTSPNYDFEWGDMRFLPQTYTPKGEPQVEQTRYNVFVNGGTIHAYKDRSYNNFKCIIPKGTKYWTDADGCELATCELIIIRNIYKESGILRWWHNLIDKKRWNLD